VPSQFVFLAPSVRFAMAVDVSKSRLYLFENTAAGPVLKHDYYASVGKLGTSKRSEGDLRTPLGVYFITGVVDPRKLAERYGAGALPLNYPNQLDQLRGRTGSGIWLHGVEPATFTRAPLATDGCVAVSNPDLREISHLVNRQQTPVVIAESLNWIDAAKAPAQQSDFMQRFNAWRDARLAQADDLQQKFYSQTIHTPADASSPTASQAQRDERSRSVVPVSVNNLSVLAWHDEDEVMIVTYTEAAKREPQGRLKRQYWLRQGGDWSIIFEGTIS
jgi:murein L,D-transpeptidase YafK